MDYHELRTVANSVGWDYPGGCSLKYILVPNGPAAFSRKDTLLNLLRLAGAEVVIRRGYTPWSHDNETIQVYLTN